MGGISFQNRNFELSEFSVFELTVSDLYVKPWPISSYREFQPTVDHLRGNVSTSDHLQFNYWSCSNLY